jgi:hypothetical protein
MSATLTTNAAAAAAALFMCLHGWNTHASLLTAAPALAEL